MIKILHIVPTLGYGGISKVVLNYRESIDSSKFSFSFITHGEREDFHNELINQGSVIYYLKSIGKQGIWNYKKDLQKIVNENYFDIVHVHMSHLNGLFSYILHLNGVINIVTHAHTAKLPNKKHFIFLPILRYINNKYSTAQIACGHDAGRFCYKKYPFTVLNNSIDYSLFNENTIGENSLRNSLNLDSDSILIGHVGAFIRQKNHKFIVQYFKKISQILPNVYLILVGVGQLKERVMKSFDNETLQRVFFLGKRNDVYSIMKQLDIFILPSLFEGLPVVGIEAQTAGLNCIISKNVDKNIDIKLGLVTFLPIEKGVEKWVETTLDKINNPTKVSNGSIVNALRVNEFDITVTKNILENIYIKTSQREVNSK